MSCSVQHCHFYVRVVSVWLKVSCYPFAIIFLRMSSTWFHFLLLFVLFKFTRGFNGIPVVCDYCLENWDVFVSDFDSFSKGLVKHCEAVSKEKGKSYLAHREGLHMAYSGLNFIRTLTKARIREGLVSFCEKWAHVVSQLAEVPGSVLSAADIIAMGDSIPEYVAVAIQKGHVKMAAKYNSMDCMRMLMHTLEDLFRCKDSVYDDGLHSWFLARQSKKYRRSTESLLRYFGAITFDALNRAVARMRRALSVTDNVNSSTMYVLFCETRQACNKYSSKGVCYLIQMYDSSAKVRDVVSSARDELQHAAKCKCHTVQLLEAVRIHLGLSLTGVRKQQPKRILVASELAFQLGRRRLCPKVELDGIPEYQVLVRALSVVYVKVQRGAPLDGLRRAASCMGVTYSKSLKKKALSRRVHACMRNPQSTGARKRSHAELVQAVVSAGGNVRWYESVGGRRVRCRMSKEDMEAFVSDL